MCRYCMKIKENGCIFDVIITLHHLKHQVSVSLFYSANKLQLQAAYGWQTEHPPLLL